MTALILVSAIALFLVLDYAFVAFSRRGTEPVIREAVRPALSERLAIPGGRFLSPGHTWVSVDEDGTARVGVSPFVRHAMGDPSQLDLPEPGKKVVRGEPLFSVIRKGRRLVLPSPVTGVVSEARGNDARESGWLLGLVPKNLGAEIRRMFVGGEAEAWLHSETLRFRDFLVDGLRAEPATLPDGGLPARGALNVLPNEMWEEFEEEFLSIHD